MPPLDTRDIDGVELARTGTFLASTGKVTFTRQDFMHAESAYEALRGKVDLPVKLGHADDQQLLQEDGYPAAGWLENVRREGNRLLADLRRVPARIASLMQAGAYRKRSIEALRNGEFGGQRYPFVVTGLALLGEDLPAVDGLKDIESLYQAASLDLPQAADAETEVIVIVAELGPEVRRMDLTKLRELLGLAADADEAAIEAAMKEALEKGGKVEGLETALAELKKQVEAGGKGGGANDGGKGGANDGGQRDDEVAELKQGNAELLKRLAALESASATEKATALVDGAIRAGKFAPAARESLIKLCLTDQASFQVFADSTPEQAIFAKGAQGGGSEDTFDLASYEPNADEMLIARQLGNSREDVILAKLDEAELAGVAVPQAVRAKLQPETK